MLNKNDKIKLSNLMKDGLLDRLLDDIKVDLANEIIKTSSDQKDLREELYMQSVSLDKVKMKLQDCVNDIFEIGD